MICTTTYCTNDLLCKRHTVQTTCCTNDILTSSSLHPNPSNPHHQDTISAGSTLPYNTLHNTTAKMISLWQKLNRLHMHQFFLFIRKNNEPTTSIRQHSRSKWFSEEEETSLLRQNKNKSMIFHKI